MFPHERSLVKRLEGKPFALIGVNSDQNRDQCKKQNQAEQITWRSFWSGPNGTNGPVAKQFSVRGWPTLLLIDHKGIVRKKWLGNPGDKILDDAIDELVAEAEQGNNKKKDK